MIRIHNARLRLCLAGLAILQFKLLALRHGFGEHIESLQIQNRLGARAEGNGLLDVGEIERNGVRSACSILRMALKSGFSKLVPRYC